MKRKLLLIPLALLLAISLVAIGCPAPEEEVPTPPPEEEEPTPPPPEEEAPPEVIELIYNDHNPAESGPGQTNIYWAETVNELSEGRLNLTVYSGAALYTGEEVYRAVQTGACDLGLYVVDAREGFALNNIMALPFLNWPEQHVEDKYMALMNEFPEMRAEWEGVTILSVMMMPPTHIHTVDKVVKTPSDIKGMKIMGAEYMQNAAMEAAGATPITVEISEMSVALSTGLVEGVMNHFPVCMIFGALEFMPYHAVFGEGGINMTPAFLIMNTEKLNSIPTDLKQLMVDAGPLWCDKFTENTNAELGWAQGYCTENNHTFTYLTPEEIEVWYNLAKPIHDEWIADCEAKGLPGQAVYDEALRLARE